MPKSFLLRRHLKQEWNSKEEVLPMSGSLHLGLWGGLPSETNNMQKPDFKGQKIVEERAENKAFMLDNNANTLKYPGTEHSHFEDVTSNQSLREFGEEKDSPKDGAFSKVAEYSKARARLGSNGKISKRQQTSVDQETRQPREAASKKIGSSCPTPSGKQPYKCNQCGKIFKTKYTLTIHLKMPSHTGARPFVCGICGKGFRLSSTLCRHKIIHTSDKPHKCHICEKAFNRSSTLKTHIRTHSELKEFLCDICGKGFHQKGNLRNHVLIHTGEKPYRCSLCDKAFNKLSNLKFHMHIHTDNAPYRCRYCKTCFTRRCDLKLHISDCHRRK